MINIRTNISEVFIPFLLVSIGTIVFYNSIRYVVDLKLKLVSLSVELWDLWFPMILSFTVVSFFLAKRIRILKVKGQRNDGHFLYQMAFAIAIPLCISQYYLTKNSFELIDIKAPEQIIEYKNEKYFDIRSYKIDDSNCVSHVTNRTTGRYNDNLIFYLYVACKFKDSNNLWYGLEFTKNISNRGSDKSKQIEYEDFIYQSELQLANHNYYNARYFERLRKSDKLNGFKQAIKSKVKEDDKDQIVLEAQNENFQTRSGNSLNWIFGSFGIGSLLIFILTIFPDINTKELRNLKTGKKPKKDEFQELLLEILNPFGPMKGLAILLLVNLIVFITLVLIGVNPVSPSSQELLEFGGSRRLEVLNGEYWRLLSSIFIHAGIMHLFMNLIGLGVSAFLLEKIIHPLGLILMFLTTGIIASSTSVYWNPNSVSVGSSGGIFGLYGLILAFAIFDIFPNDMFGMVKFVLFLMAGLTLVIGLTGIMGSVDNSAHIGGLVSGVVIGAIISTIFKERLKKNAR